MRTLTPEAQNFEDVAARVGPAMLRFARRRVDPATADDVVSEALVVVWRRFAEMPAGEETAWAIGVTRWCLANAERAARRQRGLVARLARLSSADDVVALASEVDASVHEALDRLSAEDREILRLWAWDDLRPYEIAAVLGITPQNVSVRLHRAKQRLSLALSDIDRRAAGRTTPESPADPGTRTR